jgi:hypothetical protein
MSCSDDLLLPSSEAKLSETSSGNESIDGDADNVEYTANYNDDELPPLEEGSSGKTSKLLSGIDDVKARYQLRRSIQEVRSLINGKPDLSKILDFETQNGLLSSDDVNKLFTEEELNMDRSMLRVTKWRKFTEKRWNSLSETTQMQATQLFHYSGLDLFPNKRKARKARKAIHQGEISVKTKHAVCSKYKIEGDNYCYNFNAVSTNIVNLKEDYCLSIGSCSFFPAFQNKTFNYKSYLKFLQKYVLVDGVVPIIFNPSRERRPMNNSVGASSEIDTSMILNGEWLNSVLGDSFDPVLCEKTLFHHALVISPSELEERLEQAALLENMGDKEYCVLTFGQFQQLSGLLMKTVAVDGKRERLSKTLGGYIMLKHLRCKWGKSFSCTRRVTIIVDALHRVVFMRCSGKHDSERCSIENRKKCFLAYRNIMTAHNQKNNAEDTFIHVKHQYEDVFHIISELGVFPTGASLVSWKRPKLGSHK